MGETAAVPVERVRIAAPGRWWQLTLGVICMSMIANLQYGWTLFVNPINDKHHWGLPAIQVAFTIFVVVETWLVPFEGYLVDRFGPRMVGVVSGILVAASGRPFTPLAGADLNGDGNGGQFPPDRARRNPVRTGREGLVHEVGTARSDLAPEGKVFVHGEIWDAVAEAPVREGESVEVVGVRDMILAVRPHGRQAVG